jgi:hypothetical protein
MIPYWTRNNRIVRNLEINKPFHEILHMPDEELRQWIDDVRAFGLEVWNEYGSPPLTGKSKEQIEEDFLKIRRYDISRLRRTDEVDGERNVILSPTNIGSSVSQFFPNMWQTKINGHSIYEEFADDRRFRRSARPQFRRQFRRDSFYRYSQPIKRNSEDGIMAAKSGAEWIKKFSTYPAKFEGYGFWLSEVDEEDYKSSGYPQIDTSNFLSLTKDEVHQGIRRAYIYRSRHLTNVEHLRQNRRYQIRLYKTSTRMFPAGFQAFRLGHQAPVNFPPLVAKFLCDKYTEDVMGQEVVTVLDPCAGWAGRLVGALALDDRRVHFVGNDPNSDNFPADLDMSRYEYLAQMFLATVGNHYGHSIDIFQEGSEEIHKHPRFQQYKGQVDFVLTSSPYFSKELYSEDPTQSAIKFPEYPRWRDGFLRPTLQTCVEWLRPNRFLALNTADVRINGGYVPLERDSNRILKELGMEDCGLWKLLLSGMPGANRIDASGEPTTKHWCILNGRKRKVEPIFIWRKAG